MEVPQFWLDSSDEFTSFSDGSCLARIKRVSSERLGADQSTAALHRKPRRSLSNQSRISDQTRWRGFLPTTRWTASEQQDAGQSLLVCVFAPSSILRLGAEHPAGQEFTESWKLMHTYGQRSDGLDEGV
jgi:hypothetical protein